MSARFFLDTNILIYTFDHEAAQREKAIRLVGEALQDGRGMISFQVVQEFLSAMLHKVKHKPIWNDLYSHYEEILAPLCRVYPDPELYRQALRIQHDTKYHFYDSLIIASAVAGGCKYLYSEDLHDGQRISGVTIQNPF